MSLPESQLKKLFDACTAITQSIVLDQLDDGSVAGLEEIFKGINAGDTGLEIRICTKPLCVQLLAYLPNEEIRLIGKYVSMKNEKNFSIN